MICYIINFDFFPIHNKVIFTMRILQICSAKNFGGGEKHLVDLIDGLNKRGHEIFIAAPENSPVSAKIFDIPKKNILNVNLLNSLDIFTAKKIASFIKEKNIEIVHAHLAKDYLPASLAVRFSTSAKLVLTRHVLFSMKRAQKYALKNVSKVVAVSRAVGKKLQKTFPAEKIVVISNGIKIENWENVDNEKLRENFRFEQNISFDVFLIGTIGELKFLKGQKDFVKAAKIVIEKFPATHFLIVGRDNSSEKSFEKELGKMIENFGLENHFTRLDWVENTAPALAALDVFVSASHTESFGLAILEAMRAKCAIIATETEGAKELIENGKSGILTAIENSEELSNEICRLLKDKNLRRTLGENAQIRSRENFSLEKMIDETEKVYKELVQK